MTNKATPAPIRARLTKNQPFFYVNTSLWSPLFAVREGVPLPDALNYAANFLDTAARMTEHAALEVDSPASWSASYLVEIAKALVESAVNSLAQEGASHV